jgi:hypothetical protein
MYVLLSHILLASDIHAGIDFGVTAAIFRATALRVQNLLAEITPSTPEANLPVEFNAWLRDTVSDYPTGCTYAICSVSYPQELSSSSSRATNVFNYYMNKMNAISASTGVTPVPNCFPLFHNGVRRCDLSIHFGVC